MSHYDNKTSLSNIDSDSVKLKLLFFVVDCKWSEFSDWSFCSVTCGDGTITKRRKVIQYAAYGGEECSGEDKKIKSCNLGPCPGK